jgi:hypothetical protein
MSVLAARSSGVFDGPLGNIRSKEDSINQWSRIMFAQEPSDEIVAVCYSAFCGLACHYIERNQKKKG